MKKIKIIDLLNKVANGEEVPQEIRYQNIIRYFDKDDQDYIQDYKNDEREIELYLFHTVLASGSGELLKERLNDEVEIIEEDIKENPTFEEYMKNPEKYWNNLLEKLDEIKQYLKND